MIENNDVDRILEILENLEDEQLAVELLAEFNRSTSELGKILLNLDQSLGHDEWKALCDKAQARLDVVVKKINEL